ncbi:6-phosphofructo-2-kinase 1 [Aulographum hederae CBS 113979]|uniref:6-phosphofructo-2-kinase 1 n=1 Tax=Aulographum hederae CBS 113979 TaxID=1176131 RepID=A0A6G1HC26_9PEZI|nr:6-phosphofructo-2-kinase 1 [Aulographum hederae CBS 113979]
MGSIAAHESNTAVETRRDSTTDTSLLASLASDGASDPLKPPPYGPERQLASHGVGYALSDTPMHSRPSSPRIHPRRQNSSSSTPRMKPTTLDIPGLTKSKVSPDGRIATRDVGSKLIIVMVGLPARGKSYITKKLARYLNWLQHDTRIFNVGERRRVAASTGHHVPAPGDPSQDLPDLDPAQIAAQVLINGQSRAETMNIPSLVLPEGAEESNTPTNDVEDDSILPEPTRASTPDEDAETAEQMDQSAQFFDPKNKRAAIIREQVAMETLHDLLDYILVQGGAVGIFDATNSTLERRKLIMQTVRQRAGQEINVLFIESVCEDQTLLESNMRLKLSGPDYKDKDPEASLADFRKRVAIYEKNYIPLGVYEEKNNMPYVKMIDVGRKTICHQIKGFLSSQAVYYLLNFNLAPRQIWITRHGESMDNLAGKIGGDSELSENGVVYAKALTKFINDQRKQWDETQRAKYDNTHFPPLPGDHTPPNPYYSADNETVESKNFCVWTSMLKRSAQSAAFFDEEEYEVKEMRMLDELNAGALEGLTYPEIRSKFPEEYERRQSDRLHYRYPGPGGEGYLDVINRLRPVIVELERMTDHVLLIGHRSVSRVLLAYFRGLTRDEVADLECPLGMCYMLEPKPYGVEFKAFRYNAETDSFDYLPNYELKRSLVPQEAQK